MNFSLPVFVNADLSFKAGGVDLIFKNRLVSQFGVSSLPWGPLRPVEVFGTHTVARIEVQRPRREVLQIPALILREQTRSQSLLCLRFRASQLQLSPLMRLIEVAGTSPREYQRRYPRIPADSVLATVPMHATLVPREARVKGLIPSPLVFNVRNLSPNGVLLSSENRLAEFLLPGGGVEIVLEPRGWFPTQVHVKGEICRIYEDLAVNSGNRVRYLGVQFTEIAPAERETFLELLKDVLVRLKKTLETAEKRT